MNIEQSGFRFEIAEVRELPRLYPTGLKEPVYVIFLSITNLTPETRSVTLSTTTYITKDREQLEQDNWLSGYLILDGCIEGNAHRKSGLVFHKKHLSGITPGDSLYVKAVIPDRGKKLTLRFENEGSQGNMPWVICDSKVEDFDVTPSPRVLAKELGKKLERLEAFEERLGIVLEKLSVKISDNYAYLTIVGEVHLAVAKSLTRDIDLVAVLYDSEGTIEQLSTIHIYRHSFAGFDVFQIQLSPKQIDLTNRIRIFPKESGFQMP